MSWNRVLTAVVFCVLASQAAAQPLFTDTFDSGLSPSWGNETGDWIASGGRYFAQTAQFTDRLTYSSLPFSLTDFTFDVDIIDAEDGGIWLRTTGAPGSQNGILLVTGGDSADPATGRRGLYWHVVTNGTTGVALEKVTGLFDVGAYLHIQVAVSGNTYRAFVNGEQSPATTLTTSLFSIGMVGLYDHYGQAFDNVKLSVGGCPQLLGQQCPIDFEQKNNLALISQGPCECENHTCDPPGPKLESFTVDLPATVLPGASTTFTIDWNRCSDCNPNAVIYSSLIGDWSLGNPLYVRGAYFTSCGQTARDTVTFTAPTALGTYRVRWIMCFAFDAIRNFCGEADTGTSFEPGACSYVEASFEVCSKPSPTPTPSPTPAPPSKKSRWMPINPNPENPTIILVHGLEPEQELKTQEEILWTGRGSKQATTLIRNFFGNTADQINILEYIWEGGFQPFALGVLPTCEAYIGAKRYIEDAGASLAKELRVRLDPDLTGNFNGNLDFIGHSLGTGVIAHGIKEFVSLTRTHNGDKRLFIQFTALDRPHHIERLECDERETAQYRLDSDFFCAVLPEAVSGVTQIRVDNYYSRSLTAVGDVAYGDFVYNQELQTPGTIDNILFQEGVDIDHSGVHQWYRWSIMPNSLTDDSFCNGCTFLPSGSSGRWAPRDSSLSPCCKGWYWSLNAFPTSFPESNASPCTRKEVGKLTLKEIQSFGCEETSEGTILCSERSSPFFEAIVDVSESAHYLTFDYRFSESCDSDYVALYLNNEPAWVFAATSAGIGQFAQGGPISIRGLGDNTRLTIVLFSNGESGCTVEIGNFRLVGISANQPPRCSIAALSSAECEGEITPLALSGAGSTDPDGDALTYSWRADCPGVSFDNPTSPAPTVTIETPCGADVSCVITLTVNDGQLSDTCTTSVEISACRPPDTSLAVASTKRLWPPNHKFSLIRVVGVTDPDNDPFTIEITGITQDEPVRAEGSGGGRTWPDGVLLDADADGVPEVAAVRAERSGNRNAPGNGRVYTIEFVARNDKGCESPGTVKVCVPHDQGFLGECVDDGQLFDSTEHPETSAAEKKLKRLERRLRKLAGRL